MISPTYIEALAIRREEWLAECARERLIAQAHRSTAVTANECGHAPVLPLFKTLVVRLRSAIDAAAGHEAPAMDPRHGLV